GLAVPGRFHARHYHPTSLTASFAAAAVAGRLYCLTEDPMVPAFGIFGSQASGIIHDLADGPWAKPRHPRWDGHARAGPPHRARAPARGGLTGPGAGLGGHARLLSGVRGDVPGGNGRGTPHLPGPERGAERPALQAVSVRLHRPALHGLRAEAPRRVWDPPRG